ncbi:unnamed protein product [Hydatigera taeniaeformis]|uniref:Metallophos domain-containing protein n=1 Tax=Hydatigena taeniaeformis TaxID=6205 RepID=A0A0R3X858_HYDTA|nr:unnamed protein product [Hydatigera taeniaeformis]
MLQSKRYTSRQQDSEDIVITLVCGDVCGHFKTLYARIKKVLSTAGSFEALFCVGDFFGENGEDFEKLCEDSSAGMLP